MPVITHTFIFGIFLSLAVVSPHFAQAKGVAVPETLEVLNEKTPPLATASEKKKRIIA